MYSDAKVGILGINLHSFLPNITKTCWSDPRSTTPISRQQEHCNSSRALSTSRCAQSPPLTASVVFLQLILLFPITVRMKSKALGLLWSGSLFPTIHYTPSIWSACRFFNVHSCSLLPLSLCPLPEIPSILYLLLLLFIQDLLRVPPLQESLPSCSMPSSRSRLGTFSTCYHKTQYLFYYTADTGLYLPLYIYVSSLKALNISKSSILRTELTQERHSNMCRLMGGNLWEYSVYFGKSNKGSRHFWQDRVMRWV